MKNNLNREVLILEDRDDLLEIKRNEIISIIEKTRILLHEEGTDSKKIMDSFLESGGISFTPPQQMPPMMRMLTIDSLNYKGESIKPGNIKLNIRCVIEHLSDLIENTVEFATGISILRVCAILNIWKVLKDITTVEITKEQAITIISLGENCNQQKRITLEKGFKCFKNFYESIEKCEGTWEQYIKIVNDLEKIGSLKLDINGIWLCESVNITYK